MRCRSEPGIDHVALHVWLWWNGWTVKSESHGDTDQTSSSDADEKSTRQRARRLRRTRNRTIETAHATEVVVDDRDRDTTPAERQVGTSGEHAAGIPDAVCYLLPFIVTAATLDFRKL
jgi:hypothetical protein